MVESFVLRDHGQYTFCHVLEAKASTHQVGESKFGTCCVVCLYVKLFALMVPYSLKYGSLSAIVARRCR
jgi:hypothetical protein